MPFAVHINQGVEMKMCFLTIWSQFWVQSPLVQMRRTIGDFSLRVMHLHWKIWRAVWIAAMHLNWRSYLWLKRYKGLRPWSENFRGSCLALPWNRVMNLLIELYINMRRTVWSLWSSASALPANKRSKVSAPLLRFHLMLKGISKFQNKAQSQSAQSMERSSWGLHSREGAWLMIWPTSHRLKFWSHGRSFYLIESARSHPQGTVTFQQTRSFMLIASCGWK